MSRDLHVRPRAPRRSFAAAMSSLWIINKAGGLVFQSEHFVHPHRHEGAPELSSNDYLIMAGTLHGIHAITSRINPAPGKRCSGLESLEAENLSIHVKLTQTGACACADYLTSGTKFVLLTAPTHPNPQSLLKRAYELYVDHVMKNPFYIAEMPVRVQDFDQAIDRLLT